MPAPQTELSRHFRCLKAVADVLRASGFDGITDKEIYLRKLSFQRIAAEKLKAGMYVTPTPERITPRGQEDVFGYGIAITDLSLPSNQIIDDEEQINRTLLRREKLYELLLPLSDVALLGCDFVRSVMIEPGFIFDASLFAAGFDSHQLIVRCESNKLRGMTQSV